MSVVRKEGLGGYVQCTISLISPFWPKQKSERLWEKDPLAPTVTQIALVETGMENHGEALVCCSVFSAVVKYPVRSDLREKGSNMGSQFGSSAMGRGWWGWGGGMGSWVWLQEYEVAHMLWIWKQREGKLGVHLAFSFSPPFIQSRTQAHRIVSHPHSGCVFPPKLTLPRNAVTGIPWHDWFVLRPILQTIWSVIRLLEGFRPLVLTCYLLLTLVS